MTYPVNNTIYLTSYRLADFSRQEIQVLKCVVSRCLPYACTSVTLREHELSERLGLIQLEVVDAINSLTERMLITKSYTKGSGQMTLRVNDTAYRHLANKPVSEGMQRSKGVADVRAA